MARARGGRGSDHPGPIDFGTHRARSHVRFAYTRSLADIEEGVERLARLLGPSR